MMWRSVLALVLFTACAVNIAAAQEARKLSFGELSKAQIQGYAEMVNRYANFDATLQYCDVDADFEVRFVAAVTPCITRETIKRAVTDYQTRLRFYSDKFRAPDVVKKDYCTSNAEWLPVGADHLNYVVEQAKSMCANHLIAHARRNRR